MAGENHPILPRPGIDDLIDLEQGRARTRINDDVLLQRAQRVAERQTRNNRAINQLRAEKKSRCACSGNLRSCLRYF
jgi:hypothetical protein